MTTVNRPMANKAYIKATPTFVLFQRFVSHVTTLKQNNFTETKHCFAFVLFQFYFSFISDVTTALGVIFIKE